MDYSELSDEEAEAYFDEFKEALPERVAGSGGGRRGGLDLSPESLVPAWEWFLDRREAGSARAASCPPGTSRIQPSSQLSGCLRRRCPTSTRSPRTSPTFLLENVPGAEWGSGGCPSGCSTRRRTSRS